MYDCNNYQSLLSDNKWLIVEKDWAPKQQKINETIFTLGNGYIGSRGVLEEIPATSSPGTFFAGIYDTSGSKVPDLVNAPNPVDFRISASGEKFDLTAMDIKHHKRILDLYKGLLVRETLFVDSQGNKFSYQSLRFFSMDNVHLAVMQIIFIPIDYDITLTIQNAVDLSMSNSGGIEEGKKRHYNIYEFVKKDSVNFLSIKTLQKDIFIDYASLLEIKKGEEKPYITPHRDFNLNIKRGETVRFTSYFSFYHLLDCPDYNTLKKQTIKRVKESAKKGYERLLKRHINAWEKRWEPFEINIEGDIDIERSVHFNLYHLLISALDDHGNTSIGARTLSGEGYRGHVFWDTEIFILPFFIFNDPKIAKSLLLYRYKKLNAARTIAKKKGFEGAMFPWESADTGEEATPTWAKGLNGNIIRIHTTREQHISADIAYAVYYYYITTLDVDFMLQYGLELLIEIARFWLSRLEWNEKDKIYGINHVIGPDEFHEDVNNSVYTNRIAQWSIQTTSYVLKKFTQDYEKELSKLFFKLNLPFDSLNFWEEKANLIYLKKPPQGDHIIEAFDQFFQRKFVPINELNENMLPVIPESVKMNELDRTQLVKQADVVMLLYLFSEDYTLEEKAANYYYYDKRTLHKSSLSPAIYSIIASEIGNKVTAFHYFLISLYADLRNIHGNTREGIHAASLGGTWQAVINGFGGLRIKKGLLSFDPHLPEHWKALSFKIMWRNREFSISITYKDIKISFKSQIQDESFELFVFGKMQKVLANKTLTIDIK
ncbi:MAG: glycosyl hydrolase family 65 protein [bacterium]